MDEELKPKEVPEVSDGDESRADTRTLYSLQPTIHTSSYPPDSVFKAPFS